MFRTERVHCILTTGVIYSVFDSHYNFVSTSSIANITFAEITVFNPAIRHIYMFLLCKTSSHFTIYHDVLQKYYEHHFDLIGIPRAFTGLTFSDIIPESNILYVGTSTAYILLYLMQSGD